MKILAINAGSSSLKFQMYEMPEEIVLISGVFERIGIGSSFYTIKINGEKIRKEVELNNHEDAVHYLTSELIDNNIIKSLDEIKGIGHRVVHGADKFSSSIIINDAVVEALIEFSPLAPLHNPAGITGIRAFKKAIPNATAVAVFDTAFHQTMKEENYLYALPYEWCKDNKVRKYGFHGTSHKYVSERVNEILGSMSTKVITCHIGNGASLSAIKDGKCINTSMGFTPNAGLIMGSRSGDIDATIMPYMAKQLGVSVDEIENIMNKGSGYLGITGISSDSRDIEDGIKEGNPRCILAQKMYVRRIIDYIAKYYVELEGCDAIVFTAGIGENAINTRKDVINGLKVLGIKLDEEANNVRGKETKITTEDSTVPVYIIPTDEEVMISRDTYSFLK